MRPDEIKGLISRLENLGAKGVRVKAAGKYPVARRTPVQDVAMYQNNGTERITPSRFVERAEAKGGWDKLINNAGEAYLKGGGDIALLKAGSKIASDISDMCDRIDTGQLKASFVAGVL